jgi:hypothetical protein
VGLPVTQRPAAGLDDVGGGVEVGLADLEVDDLVPPGLERLGLREHREGGLRPQPLHSPRQFHPRLLFPDRAPTSPITSQAAPLTPGDLSRTRKSGPPKGPAL